MRRQQDRRRRESLGPVATRAWPLTLALAACAAQPLLAPAPARPSADSALDHLVALRLVPGTPAEILGVGPTGRKRAGELIARLSERAAAGDPEADRVKNWLPHARGRWEGEPLEAARALRLDEAALALRAALLERGPSAALARFWREAATEIWVADEDERGWAIARIPRHAAAFAAAEDPELDAAFAAYAEALAVAPTRTPRRPPVEGGAIEAATARFEADRQRLYVLSLEVAPDGPAGIERRIGHALPLALTRRPWLGLAPEVARLDRWLNSAGAHGRLERAQERLIWASATATGSASLVPMEPAGADEALATLAVIAARAAADGEDRRLSVPLDPASRERLVTERIFLLARSSTGTAEARLLLAARVAERHARAVVDLRRTEPAEKLRQWLVERALHDPEKAEATVSAVRREPTRFSAGRALAPR